MRPSIDGNYISKTCLVTVAIAFVFLGTYVSYLASLESVSFQKKSPSGMFIAKVLERGRGLDRQFAIAILDRRTGQQENVFQSPDEGRPAGTERLYWSPDERYLLLTSKHVFVNDSERLPSGRYLYMIYDRKNRSIKCNSSQLLAEQFGIVDLLGIGFQIDKL